MIQLRYFASLRERLGCDAEQLEQHPDSVRALKAALAGRGGVWAEVFTAGGSVLAAVNQEMAKDDRSLFSGDEVGFFPPVTGG